MKEQAIMLIISVFMNLSLLIIIKVILKENKFLKIAYKSRAKACDEVWSDYEKTVEEFCKESMERFDKLIEVEKENKKLNQKLYQVKKQRRN